jgi:hypothetical protein
MDEGDDRIVIKGLGDITEEVKAKLAERRFAALVEASKRLTLAAKAGRERFHVGDGDNGGYVQFMADPFVYHQFGQRWGYDCWKDKDFIRHTLKHIPEMKVVSRSRKTTVPVQTDLTPRRKDAKGDGDRINHRGHREHGEKTGLVAVGAGVQGAVSAAPGRYRRTY